MRSGFPWFTPSLSLSLLVLSASWLAPSGAIACSGISPNGRAASTAPAGGVLELSCFGGCGPLSVTSEDGTRTIPGKIVASGSVPVTGGYPDVFNQPNTWALWKPDSPFRVGQKFKATVASVAGVSATTDVTIVAADANDAATPVISTLEVVRATGYVGDPTCCSSWVYGCPPTPAPCFTPRRVDSARLSLTATLAGNGLVREPTVSRQWFYRVNHGASANTLSPDTNLFLPSASASYEVAAGQSTHCVALEAENAASGKKLTFPVQCADNTLQNLGERDATQAERESFAGQCTSEPAGFHDEWCAGVKKSCSPVSGAPTPPCMDALSRCASTKDAGTTPASTSPQAPQDGGTDASAERATDASAERAADAQVAQTTAEAGADATRASTVIQDDVVASDERHDGGCSVGPHAATTRSLAVWVLALLSGAIVRRRRAGR